MGFKSWLAAKWGYVTSYISKQFGLHYFVNGTTGNNSYDGLTPENAKATIANAITTSSAGDTIHVAAGTYDEGIAVSKALTIIFEQGVVLNNTTPNTVLTVNASNCTIVGGVISQAGQTGLNIASGNYNKIIDTRVISSTVGFQVASGSNELINCYTSGHTSTGFDITGGTNNKYVGCTAVGTGGATVGFLVAAGADYGVFTDCISHRNTTNAFNLQSNSNTLKHCSGDREITDGGSNIVVDYTIGSQITAGQSRDQDLEDIYDKISPSHVGNRYYVSTAGSDSNPGTVDNPFLTIDYAVGQCSANNGDIIYIMPGAYDENANAGGVLVDVAGITIIGIQSSEDLASVTVVNSNAGATAVFTVSVNDVTIQTLTITEATNTVEGIVSTGSYNLFEHLQLAGAMENGFRLTGATQNTIRECNIFGQTNDGIELAGATTHCIIEGSLIGIATDNGIHFNGGSANENIVRNTRVLGAGTTTNGIHINAADNNIISPDVEINNCTVGILLAAGSQNNTLNANLTCTTNITDNSGNATNSPFGSITHLHDDVSHIPKFTGTIWFVDGTNGNDNNSGHAPTSAFATIGQAITSASAGDRIQVFQGIYDEASLDMNVNGLEMFCEWGTIIRDTTPGPCLTISADYCVLRNAIFLPTTAQIGLDLTATSSYADVIECVNFGCSVGFNVAGIAHNLRDCRSLAHTTTGYDVVASYCKFINCTANGNNAAVRGVYLSNASADNNYFENCGTSNNTTAGWEVVAGANQNLFSFCFTGGTDGARVDSGTSNSWPGFPGAGEMCWSVEQPQTGTTTLTLQNTWYQLFTAYTSSTYAVRGGFAMDLPANQTYELRITRYNVGRNPSDVTTYAVGAAAIQKTIDIIAPTHYLEVEIRCTSAAGQVVTYDRALEFLKQSDGAALT